MPEHTPPRPLCFVAMPFGAKPRPDGGGLIDFDAVYHRVIRPAVEDASMEPVRADEEQLGGIIHKPMFERLLLSDYVVADLTTANANVFYELGVRHAVRPFSTILVAAAETRLPFDLGPVRTLRYHLDGADPADPVAARTALADALAAAREHPVDSPVYQLIEGFGPPDIERLRTDAFRDRVEYSARVKTRLAAARRAADAEAALDEVRASLGPIGDEEAGVGVDLFLAYRDAGAFDKMLDVAESLAPEIARTALVREQTALALNRLGRDDEAERILLDLIEQRGPSSETHGLLGRVYKDRWEAARASGRDVEAAGWLERAIDAYLTGFESDWRDAYPGINALTLMELADPPDPRRASIAPVVVYSARRRVEAGNPDYWDHATLFEAAVLADDRDAATQALRSALATNRADWQIESTLANLGRIVDARRAQGRDQAWYGDLQTALAGARSVG